MPPYSPPLPAPLQRRTRPPTPPTHSSLAVNAPSSGVIRDKLEKEREDRERDVKSLSTQLDKERADHKEDVEALQRVRPQVHVRLLTLNATGHATHYTSSSPCSIGPCTREGSRALQLRFLGRPPRKQKRVRIRYSMLSNVPNCPSAEAVAFLCSYNNVRRTGNSAAHTAKQEEVRAAVTTKLLETNDRRCLEQIYIFAYGQPV